MDINFIAKNLRDKGYKVACFGTAQEGKEYINSQIDGKTVGFGGSVTLQEMDLYSLLKTHNTVLWHNSPEQVAIFGNKAVRDMAINTEIYVSSVNGLSEDGVIVNIDYTGNRIGAMCYGHKKVFLIIGKNKIAPTMEEALWRARNVASPKNCQRLKRNTPCAVKGDKCYNCTSPDRICNGILIFERAMAGTETEVILINQNLGY